MKGKIDSSIMIVGDLNTILSLMDKTTVQKISVETGDSNKSLNQTDIYKTLYPITQSTIFSQMCMGHFAEQTMLGKTVLLNRF